MAWGKWVYLGEGNGEFFRALEMFCILTGVWIIQVNMFAKTHHLRFVQDVVCKWYLGGTLCVCVCVCVCVLVAQSCPTLCDPMGCSPPSSSAHGILQARVLEWVAIYWDDKSCLYGLQSSWVHCKRKSLGGPSAELSVLIFIFSRQNCPSNMVNQRFFHPSF